MPRARDNPVVRYAFLAGALALIVGLFWAGAQPIAAGLFPPPMDKVAHFATFGLIACLLWLSVLRGRVWLVIAIVIAVGIADESHQLFLPGRSAGLDDLAVDLLAAVATTAMLEYARQREG